MLIIAGAHAVNNFLKKLIRSQLCVCVLFQFNKLHHTEKFVCNIQSLPVCILVYLKYCICLTLIVIKVSGRKKKL